MSKYGLLSVFRGGFDFGSVLRHFSSLSSTPVWTNVIGHGDEICMHPRTLILP